MMQTFVKDVVNLIRQYKALPEALAYKYLHALGHGMPEYSITSAALRGVVNHKNGIVSVGNFQVDREIAIALWVCLDIISRAEPESINVQYIMGVSTWPVSLAYPASEDQLAAITVQSAHNEQTIETQLSALHLLDIEARWAKHVYVIEGHKYLDTAIIIGEKLGLDLTVAVIDEWNGLMQAPKVLYYVSDKEKA